MFIWRVFRRLLALVIRVLLINRIISLGLVAILLVGFVVIPLLSSAASAGTGAGRTPASGQPAQAASGVSSSLAPTQSPDPSVETYIKGMMTFDANLMWSSLHPQFRNELQSRGITLEQRRAQVAEMQRSGVSYQKAYYLGGYVGNSGFRYYAYVFTHPNEGGQSEGDETAYMFTVAPDGGGIINIE